MKEWNKPELLSLNVSSTYGGGFGMPADGVEYQVGNDILIGGSGPALEYPVNNPV